MHTVAQKIYRNIGNPEILELMPSTVNVVLDVGCGAGANAAILRNRGIIVDGITLSQEEANVASGECRNIYIHNLEQGLPKHLPSDYNCVICSHVVEHICWPENLLSDISTLLRPRRGTLLLALPNIMFFKNRWKLLCGRFDYETSGLMDNTHFRWYTYKSARRLLENNGFVVELARGHGSMPLWPLRSVFGSGVSKVLDSSATRISPSLFAYQLLYRARPS